MQKAIMPMHVVIGNDVTSITVQARAYGRILHLRFPPGAVLLKNGT